MMMMMKARRKQHVRNKRRRPQISTIKAFSSSSVKVDYRRDEPKIDDAYANRSLQTSVVSTILVVFQPFLIVICYEEIVSCGGGGVK